MYAMFMFTFQTNTDKVTKSPDSYTRGILEKVNKQKSPNCEM